MVNNVDMYHIDNAEKCVYTVLILHGSMFLRKKMEMDSRVYEYHMLHCVQESLPFC
jgi:hypothetical protein